MQSARAISPRDSSAVASASPGRTERNNQRLDIRRQDRNRGCPSPESHEDPATTRYGKTVHDLVIRRKVRTHCDRTDDVGTIIVPNQETFAIEVEPLMAGMGVNLGRKGGIDAESLVPGLDPGG